MAATCYVTDKDMLKHWNPLKRWMPESPKRLQVTHQLLQTKGLLDRALILESRYATDEELGLVHTKEHIELIKATEKMSLEEVTLENHRLDPATSICQETYQCARLACGCLLQAVDAVVSEKCRNGVALIRPPGHHSAAATVSGFCIFNNAAVAARYALQRHGLKRILIFDWDVHHGNGTQDIFYDSNSVLYISLHRYSKTMIFPKTEISDATYIGRGDGKGYNINIPWTKPAITDADYLTAMYQLVMPVASEFDPELVIVSAGFDSAKGDILGDCCVTPAGYQHLTSLLKNLAHGRVIIQLEGGYNVDAVAESLAACMATLMGDPCGSVTNMQPSASAMNSILRAKAAVSPYWKCLTEEPTPIVVEPECDIETWQIPVLNCPHGNMISSLPSHGLSANLRNLDDFNKWICLTCFQVLEGEIKSDALVDHAEKNQHFLVVNTHTLHVRCLSCRQGVIHEEFIPILAQLYKQE
ncbi:polyamine deacetylase HDAC10-like isoform X2 [Rhipicephalus microplus]|uniref:polyamine deacetylase HDAC10-like isoform X2 n=1 Tax=Rhipicephalus microplus TaxID=6941 RepID=UPI003F6B1718